MIETLAIVGLGLMGGSLGLAAKARGAARRVTAYARREESRREALTLGAADAVFDTPALAVADADLVVLCTPVLTMSDLVRGIRDQLAEGSVVTDVGSTKGHLVRELGKILVDSPSEFVGSHPMAGSEQTGLDAARQDLYEGARVIVTPAKDASADATERVQSFWEHVGADVSVMSPEAHDEVIARTSHLPHLVAAALVAAIDRDGSDIAPFCGPGFRDTTRVAEGSEQVWHDIVKTNLGAIRSEVDAFELELARLKALLAQEDFDGIRGFLAECREKRGKFGK
jgi:prephenate dehydrogenase